MPLKETLELPDMKEFKKFFHYDPLSGLFMRKEVPNTVRGKGILPGSFVNTKSSGYIVINFRQVQYLAHRLAFAYMGLDTPQEIDHIDNCRTNNMISNLRPATRRTNSRNTKRKSNNTSSFRGVHYDKSRGKWMAFIGLEDGFKNLGRYDKKEDAVLARRTAEIKFFGEFANFN